MVTKEQPQETNGKATLKQVKIYVVLSLSLQIMLYYTYSPNDKKVLMKKGM